MGDPMQVNEPVGKPQVPSCPECGSLVWEYQEELSGTITYRVDADGWHEEKREDTADYKWWWFECRGCGDQWSTDDHGENGWDLKEALMALPMAKGE